MGISNPCGGVIMADRKLSDIFIAPPISVLDVKQQYWKVRRNQWLNLKIESELGREKNLLKLSTLLKKKQKATSIFDPVLCEVIYRWFSATNDMIFDPFAGGSVRGIVASKLQRNYVGIDLRKEQVAHNEIQAKTICNTHLPIWSCGSSATSPIPECDLLFTCPPYYDLEKYSDDPQDLSNMNHADFDSLYASIIARSMRGLRDNRFAVIVVGDVRGADGYYQHLPQKTVQYFEDVGCRLYNDMVLLQEPATAAMRAFNYMNASRKIAKAHQNVFVFVKGDAKIATERMQRFSDCETVDNSPFGMLTLEIF